MESAAILLLALFPAGVYVQLTTEYEENALIELNNNCKCVYYYQCENGTIITDGRNLIEVRMFEKNSSIACKGGNFTGELRCCKLKNDTRNVPSQPLVRGSSETELDLFPVIIAEEEDNCGQQKTIFHSRILTDEADVSTIEGEFPWMVVIFEATASGKYQFLGSGSLIHPKVVLTAAHKVYRKKSNELSIVVNGKIVLSGEEEASPDEKRSVSEIIGHPQYDSSLLYNDVALLILNKPFKLRDGQHPINTLCLPSGTVNLEGARCLVAGWGDDNTGKRTKVMKKVEVPFVNHDRCQNLLRGTVLTKFFNLHDSFMCAGGEKGKDACNGDGGSPLMCPMYLGSTKLFQAGIVSWGIDCGMENIPGVYTDVQVVSKWIRSELRNRQLSI